MHVSARSKTNTMHGTEGTEGKTKLYGLWKVFLRRAKAATKVQALWRGRTARKQFHEQLAARLAAAVLLQKAWRRCLARRRAGDDADTASVEARPPRKSGRHGGSRV